MRWLKHMTATWQDEKITRLIDEAGIEGYGFYWRTLEIVASNMTETSLPVAQLSARSWSKLSQVSAARWLRLAQLVAKCGLIRLENCEELIKVEVPNLLKYRDEYSDRRLRKILKNRDNVGTVSGQSRDNVGRDTDTDTETETEAENKHAHSGKSGTRQRTRKLSDEELIDELKKNPAFQGIDIDREIGKMKAWLLTPKGQRRQLTRAFIINWLNRIDKPISGSSTPAPIIPINRGKTPEQIQAEDEKYLATFGIKNKVTQ